MQIFIRQRKISLTSTYDISVGNVTRFNAVKRLFRLFAEIPVRDINTSEIVITIKKRFFFFKPKYDFFRGNEILEFRNAEFWYGHYQCQDSIYKYDIYANLGLKFSIFKNDTQIAWFTKNNISYFAGDEYEMWANNDSDITLLIAFCIAIDHHLFSKKRGVVNFEIGRIDFVKKDFDETWQPK